MSKITDGLYIGDLSQATSQRWLENHNITHIVNTTQEIKNVFPHNYIYLNLFLIDNPSQSLDSALERSNRFIRNAIAGGGVVLVHCYAGISRSSSIVIYYLMKSRGWKYHQVYNYLKERHPRAYPNYGFSKQLIFSEDLNNHSINVIAMEEICQSPKQDSDERILGRVAMNNALQPFFENNSIGGLRVRVIGWSERLRGAINRCGNRSPRSLQIIQPSTSFEQLDATGVNALYFYDSKTFKDPQGILAKLRALKTHIFDLSNFETEQGQQAIADYRKDHPPAQFGLRRIQCLHETGQAGARYGLGLLAKNRPSINKENSKAVILGYGNVAQGALDELYQQGVKNIHVLGRSQTAKSRIDYWLKDADLVINGAEQSAELRGKNFLITNKHIKELIPEHSVVIDLVGGSPTNRSPVEAVMSCSFLTEPYFVQEGVLVSSLWGWPMMGMMRETAIRYSGQIVEVLIGNEKLIDGLGQLKPGVKRALVCGPFG